MLLSHLTIFKTIALSLMVSTVVFADKQSIQDAQTISSPNHLNSTSVRSDPNSFVSLNFALGEAESWDAKGSQNNIISHCIKGSIITGFEYTNVRIQTVEPSYFSEAALYFSNSNSESEGVQLIIGNENSSGTAFFSSDGILDITDFNNEDIVSLSDNQFLIQFYERVDDVQNAIDARFTNGEMKVWGVDLEASNDCPFVETSNESDLSVTYTFADNQDVRVNSHIEFKINISNNGNTEATNVTIENTLSTKILLNSMSCDDGTSVTSTDDFSLVHVQNIASNSELNCSINTVIQHYGQISNSIAVNSTNDTNTDNNSANLSISGALAIVPINNPVALLILLLLIVTISIQYKTKLSQKH
jgi:uncharacterized repeat protein (TIGR01451 family)